MKSLKLFIVVLIATTQSALAQEIKVDSIQKMDKNLVKINLIGFSINGQYERILSKRFSIALSYKFLPYSKLIFRSAIPVSDQQARESLDELKLSNAALTPEVRFYVGKKGYGRGFYLAPFYRNAKFSGKGLGIDFTLDNGQNATFNMQGSIKSSTFGLLLGAQRKTVPMKWRWIMVNMLNGACLTKPL
ncbi:MAG: hypothetical protein RL642_1600 [Bacteroidota bacterium]